MGIIKEPKGVDFVIQSEPLTDKERREISQFIADYKSKNNLVMSKTTKRRVKARV